MAHEQALPVATGLILACGGCFGSEPQQPKSQPADCCAPVEAQAIAEPAAPILDQHGNPVAVQLPADDARSGG
jgi:hypothetical protein